MPIRRQVAAVVPIWLLLALMFSGSPLPAQDAQGDNASGAENEALEFSAAAAGKKIYLSWTGEIAPDVVAFEILRGEGDGELKRVGEIADLKATSYTDGDVQPNTNYRYVLRQRRAKLPNTIAGGPLEGHSGHYVRRINCGG